MTNTKSPENSPNMTSEDKLNASLGYIAVFHPSESSLHTDEANKTLVAMIPVSISLSPDQAESYLRGREIHVSVGYKTDPDLADKNADLFNRNDLVALSSNTKSSES